MASVHQTLRAIAARIWNLRAISGRRLLRLALTVGALSCLWLLPMAAHSGPLPASEAPLAPPEAGTEAEPAAPRQAEASDIPTETVSQFVRAYLQVVELVEQREIDLQRAETEAVSLQIQREIQAEAFALIEAAGLTQQQYWQLLSLANVDPNFRERVLAQVEEASL